jgi:hypothetical protein
MNELFRYSKLILPFGLVFLVLAGCAHLFPRPISITSSSPRIFELHVSPPQVEAQEITSVLIQFEYADPNGDIDLESQLEFRFSSSDPIAVNLDNFPDAITNNLESTAGTISKTIQIDTSEIRYETEINFEVALRDNANHESNSLQGTIKVIGQSTTSRVYGDCDIWFVEQPDGLPAESFRIGREVFVMVRDLTLGVIEPDVLYAEISSPSAGWALEVPLFKTGDPEVYASRLGPRLGVNVPARSGQTLVAFYRAYSDRAELCLDQAKVR